MKLALIESEQRKKHECPTCGKPKVKWQSVGIWECEKCKTKFTSKAYSVRTALALKKEEVKQLTAEEIMAAREQAAKLAEEESEFSEEPEVAEEEPAVEETSDEEEVAEATEEETVEAEE
jgi:ribosomal protein L37AE/L43A